MKKVGEILAEDRYFETLTPEELWRRYCGFLDLSIQEFMQIQNELLIDQIDRVWQSPLGRRIIGDRKPLSVEEFQRSVPITTYEDYEPELSERREEALAEKPVLWCHSSGRGGVFKWIPWTAEFIEKSIHNFIGSFILATARRRGEVNIRPGVRLLGTFPPAPYASGSIMQAIGEIFSYRRIPPVDAVKDLEFQEKVRKGFEIALKEGVDIAISISSVLVRMGEEMADHARKRKPSLSMLHPRVVFRLLGAALRSRREHRTLLPKDLWSARGIIAGGLDTQIYKKDIAHYWGMEPLDFYVSAEAALPAMQAWNKKAMTFVPNAAFLEFVPLAEVQEQRYDRASPPRTLLLDQLEVGKLYEVIITQLYGMPLLRYRMKDIIKVVALKDEETGVNLPQFVIQRKVGETIDLAGLASLDEKTLWHAISQAGVKYTDWTACKEYDGNKSYLRIFIELKEDRETPDLESAIHRELLAVDLDYRDIRDYLSLQPIRVTLLSPGTFLRYMEERRKEGADLAMLKPKHINPSPAVLEQLKRGSEARSNP